MEFLTLTPESFDQIDVKQALYCQIGDVLLVRSKNVPEHGSHFAVVSGPLTQKPYGLRPQVIVIPANAQEAELLEQKKPMNGVVALKLKDTLKRLFYAAHGLKVVGNEVQMHYAI